MAASPGGECYLGHPCEVTADGAQMLDPVEQALAVAEVELDIVGVILREAGEIARVERGDVGAEIVLGHVSGPRGRLQRLHPPRGS